MITGEQKLLAIISHLAYLLGGLGFLVAPLAIYLIKSDDYFVKEHAKQALVAHITILISTLVISFLCMLIIGILLLPILAILWLILVVTSLMAAHKALNGEMYRYPLIQEIVNKL